MNLRLSQVTVHVRDCEEAYAWYRDKLGMVKRQDETYESGIRWLTVSWPEQPELTLVLDQRPYSTDESGVGKQPVFCVETDDCVGAYELFRSRGVKFKDPPMKEVWGTTARFYDLYGNEFHMNERPKG